jgi:hypothetical protein
MLVYLSEFVGIPMCHIFPCIILVTGDWVEHLNIFMSCLACTSTCYILFGIMVVLATGPKDLFMERVTMFNMQSTGLIWVGVVE